MSFFVAAKGSRVHFSRAALKSILLTTTAIAALTLAQTAARADGGAGGTAGAGYFGGGGAGGTGSTGNAGNAGGDNSFYGAGGGGGGGAGGGTGGQGGAGTAGTHAAGGTSVSPDGATGDDQVSGDGGSGGGGGYGGDHGTVAGSIANTGSISGGAGGNGGDGGAGGGTGGGGGGGGGSGGFGAVITGSGASSNSGGGTITGGTGGNGGAGGNSGAEGGNGGDGGDGGDGVALTGSDITFTNSSTITGGSGGDGGSGGSGVSAGGSDGNGGDGGAGISAVGATIDNDSGTVSGGAGGVGGTDGAGGAGIVGSDLTITNSGTISGGLGGDGTTRANAITFTGGDNKITFGNSTSGLTGNVDVTGTLTFDQSANDVTVDNTITGTGSVAKTGTATVTLSGTNTYSGGTTISAGALQVTNDSSVGTGTVTLDGGTLQAGAATLAFTNDFAVNTTGGTVDTNGGNDLTLGGISDGDGTGGTLTIVNSGSSTGIVEIGAASDYSGATIVGDGTGTVVLEAVGGADLLSANSAVTVKANAYLNTGGYDQTIGSLAGAGTVQGAGSLSQTLTTGGDDSSTTFSGAIENGGGTLALTKEGTGTFTLSGTNTYTGGTTVTGGTLSITNSGALGSGSVAVEDGTTLGLDGTGINLTNNITVAGDPTFTVNAGNTDTISGVIADGATAGDVVKNGDGTLILSATNTYTGATTVDAGTLNVTGSIATSSLTTVNSGGTLIGTGTVGNVEVASGGTFAPGAAGVAGGATSVSGTLTLDSGSNYLVAVDPTSASYANVSGTASLAGTAIAAFDTGSYVGKQYTILTSAGLGGTTFDTFATTDLPSGFAASLEYTSTDVLLDLTAQLGAGGGLNTNQQNVASGLNYYFNNGGAMPSNFLTIFGLSGGNLATALSQLSGEAATAGIDGGFQMMDQFFGLMSGASSGGASAGGTLSFAPGMPASLPAEALAYASTPGSNEAAVGGWSYWGSAFGGWNRTDGNASIGSSTVKASSYGLAMGADFQYSADTVMGVALAYGRTEWDLSNSLGGGDSDALQLGVHGKTNFGPAYLSAAAGIANHWMTTDRYAVGDHLKADFNAQVYSGRLEAGYRFEPSLSVGLTPYAALQVQHFRSPSHTEEDLGGGGFALSYDAMSVTNTRTELGTRIDHITHLDGKLLKLGAGLAWAHDHSTNSSVTASFTSLPGSSFSVRGVSRPENAALLSGSAELKLASGWTLAANVDSEMGSGYRSYAGRGTLTYAW